MNRRTFVGKSVGFIAASAALSSASSSAVSIIGRKLNPFSVESGFTPLRNGVGIYEERGGTIGWLASDDALVVVDTQFPESAENCLKGLLERSGRKLDLLINSHHHGDHTAGNGTFIPVATESVAHENVPILQRESGERRGNLDEQVYVSDTYKTSWSTTIGKEVISLNYYGSAHTAGDSIIHFQNANVAHVGDLVFNRMAPYIDRSARATVSGWIEVLESAHEQLDNDSLVIFGHGNDTHGVTGSRKDLLVMRNYLAALRDHVRNGIKAGKSVDELIVAKLPGFESHYSASRENAVGNGIKAAFEEYSAAGE